MKRTPAGTGRWVLYVLAGTEAEAQTWADLNHMRPDRWRYVTDLDTLAAIGPADMFMPAGTYRDRPDYMPLLALVRIRELVAWTGQDAQLVGVPLPGPRP